MGAKRKRAYTKDLQVLYDKLQRKQRRFVDVHPSCKSDMEAAKKAGYANPKGAVGRLRKHEGVKKLVTMSQPDKTGKDSNTGRFASGNRWWEARSSHGAKPKFESPGDLEKACLEYFEWVEANPLYELKVFQNGTKADVPKMRAPTIWGLCTFLGITYETWTTYRVRPDLSEVISYVETAMKAQKFAGAAADLLNQSIVAREMGLAEKVEAKVDPMDRLSDDELEARLLAKLEKYGVKQNG